MNTPTKKQRAVSQRRHVTASARKPKNAGEEIIGDDVALGYHPHRVGAALPWDHAPHAVNADWAKLSQDIGPRDSGRGIRSGI